MRIQRRITLGIGILFTMILLLGIQSVGYVRQLSRATGTILADNYNSLQYAGEMLRSLNDIGQDSISRTPCAKTSPCNSRTSPRSARRRPPRRSNATSLR